jgi:hypothetical protein
MVVPTRSWPDLVPAISIIKAPCPGDRDRRDKPGDDELGATSFAPLTISGASLERRIDLRENNVLLLSAGKA